MGIHVREKSRHLYLDIIEPGRRRRWEALGLELPDDTALRKEVRKLAESICIKRMMQLAAAREGLLDPVGGKGSLLAFAQEVAKVKTDIRSAANMLKRYKPATVSMNAIDEQWFEAFRQWIVKESGLAESSAAIYYQKTRSLIRKAVRDRKLPRDPGANVKGLRVPESDKRPLTREEVDRLAAHPLPSDLGQEVARAFIFGCLTGLRISDLARLTWGDIERGEAPRLIKRTKKTGAVVVVNLNHSAWALLDSKALHKPEEPVFKDIGAGSRTPLFREWATTAKLERSFSWHDARRYFATSALAAGGSIYTIQKALGHSTSKMTETYAKMTDGLLREAVDALPEITMDAKKEKKA